MAAGTNEFEVTRDVTIAAPPATVYDLLVDFHR